MKRNRIGKITLLTLLLCLVSATIMSGTLAKYTDTVYGKSSAVVAKFDYTLTDGTTAIAGTTSEQATTVNLFNTVADTGVADSPTNLIAPGTYGTFGLAFQNKSDVAVKVAYELTLDDTAKTIPLVFVYDGKYYSDFLAKDSTTMGRTSANAGTTDGTAITIDGTIADLNTAIKNDLFSSRHEPNETTPETIDLAWFWSYEQNALSPDAGDAIDTALGKASTIADRTTLTVNIKATIVQEDN